MALKYKWGKIGKSEWSKRFPFALVANVLALGYILYRAKKQHVNPWLQEVFKGTRDYEPPNPNPRSLVTAFANDAIR